MLRDLDREFYEMESFMDQASRDMREMMKMMEGDQAAQPKRLTSKSGNESN